MDSIIKYILGAFCAVEEGEMRVPGRFLGQKMHMKCVCARAVSLQAQNVSLGIYCVMGGIIKHGVKKQ